MFPWLLFWAPSFVPHFNYPWSGAVRQAFSQDAFFSSIAATAGNGDVEQVLFNYASYGRQIGMLSDVVAILLNTTDLSSAVIAEKAEALKKQKPIADLAPEKAAEAIDQFARTYKGIETIKNEFSESRINTITRIIKTLKTGELEEIERVVQARLSEERSKP